MRRILCPKCAAKWPTKQHPEDAAMGFKMRRVEIARVRKPAGLDIKVNGVSCGELETVVCDMCNASIPNGSPAVAISQWRGGTLGNWEAEYTMPEGESGTGTRTVGGGVA